MIIDFDVLRLMILRNNFKFNQLCVKIDSSRIQEIIYVVC